MRICGEVFLEMDACTNQRNYILCMRFRDQKHLRKDATNKQKIGKYMEGERKKYCATLCGETDTSSFLQWERASIWNVLASPAAAEPLFRMSAQNAKEIFFRHRERRYCT